MLRDLVEALRDDPQLRPVFAADPTPLFDQHNVSEEERSLVLGWDEPKLIILLTFPLFEVLQVTLGHDGFIFYPGFAVLKVEQVTTAAIGAAASLELTVAFTWNHPGVPQKGLPGWLLVRIFDANKLEIQPNNRYRVPTLLDLRNQQGEIKTRITQVPAGAYSVVLDSAHPELRPSAPFAFNI